MRLKISHQHTLGSGQRAASCSLKKTMGASILNFGTPSRFFSLSTYSRCSRVDHHPHRPNQRGISALKSHLFELFLSNDLSHWKALFRCRNHYGNAPEPQSHRCLPTQKYCKENQPHHGKPKKFLGRKEFQPTSSHDLRQCSRISKYIGQA